MNDLILRQSVLDELEFEPSINAAHIGVSVENGVVSLSGHVGSYAEKNAAEKAVKRVKGVRAIAEEIEVRLPNDKKTADDEIAARAVNILQWSAVVPPGKIDIKVQDGWVVLTGQLEWQFQRNAAENEIRRLSGVAGIMNNITLKPYPQPADVKRKIEDALTRRAAVDAKRIRVLVHDGGKVALEGFAHDWRERDEVDRAAWSVPGVISVEDNLTIA